MISFENMFSNFYTYLGGFLAARRIPPGFTEIAG